MKKLWILAVIALGFTTSCGNPEAAQDEEVIATQDSTDNANIEAQFDALENDSISQDTTK